MRLVLVLVVVPSLFMLSLMAVRAQNVGPTEQTVATPVSTPDSDSTITATPIADGDAESASDGVDPVVASIIAAVAGLGGAAIGGLATFLTSRQQLKAESKLQREKLSLENRMSKYGDLYKHLRRHGDRGRLHPLDSLNQAASEFSLLFPFIDQETRAAFDREVTEQGLAGQIRAIAPADVPVTSDEAERGHALLQEKLNTVLASATVWLDRERGRN